MNEIEPNTLPASPRPMRPAFAQELQVKLRDIPMQRPPDDGLGGRWRMVAAGGVAFALIATLILSPRARAWADSFLSLFRVQRITALAVDPARIEALRNGGLSNASIESLIGDALQEDEQQLNAHAKPRQVASASVAASETGLNLRLPVSVVNDPSVATVFVQDAQTLHFKGNVTRLNALIQALGITDAAIPAQLDSAIVTVTKPASVMVKFGQEGDRFTVLQSHSPSVELPEGTNLAELGEIGLRIVGIAPDEAHRIAQTTDWNSTLLVPIPTNVGSFRNITLNNGATGLLVTTGGTGASSVRNGDGERQQSTLIWVENDVVFAVTGGFSGNVVDLANSMQ